ncbi:MAG: LamG domain-containing protein, partial [Planctomycetota bacterium]|nr:LamG domain-containing protein [Planctomycetota bacterium]
LSYEKWNRLVQLDETPNVKYRRAWTMAQYKGRLFCGTLPTGKVWSFAAGTSVTHDRELPTGWHHIAASRIGNRLKLYVDGKPVADSVEFDPAKYDLSTSLPLKLGAGSTDTFRGRLSDVRLYRGTLTAEELKRISTAE